MLTTFQRTIGSSINNLQYLGEEVFKYENIVMGIVVLLGAILIQIFFPPGTRNISKRTWVENFENILKYGFWTIFGSTIPAKYLKEYRCPNCNKLLAKGKLSHRDDILEVKCRGCSTIHMFRGEDADVIEKRSEFLKEGLIPDPDLVK